MTARFIGAHSLWFKNMTNHWASALEPFSPRLDGGPRGALKSRMLRASHAKRLPPGLGLVGNQHCYLLTSAPTFFIAPFRTSNRVMRTPFLASCSPSSRRRCARSARNVVPNGRPAKPDARSALYQYSGVGPLDPTWDSSRNLSGLVRRPFHAPDLPGTARRVAGQVIQTRSCRAH